MGESSANIRGALEGACREPITGKSRVAQGIPGRERTRNARETKRKYAQENAQGTYGVTDEERVRGNPQRVSGNMVGRTKKGTHGKTHGVAFNGKHGEREGALFTRIGGTYAQMHREGMV